MKKPNIITIENARFVYRPNFEGRPETYNDEGDRYFNVAIPPEIVDSLTADGWNIKMTKGSADRPDEFPPEPYLKVGVAFSYKPPEIVLIMDGHPTHIDEKNAKLLDSTEFENFDVVIRPYIWSTPQGSGIKAYLQTFYGTVPSDPIRMKYAGTRGE